MTDGVFVDVGMSTEVEEFAKKSCRINKVRGYLITRGKKVFEI